MTKIVCYCVSLLQVLIVIAQYVTIGTGAEQDCIQCLAYFSHLTLSQSSTVVTDQLSSDTQTTTTVTTKLVFNSQQRPPELRGQPHLLSVTSINQISNFPVKKAFLDSNESVQCIVAQLC